MRISGTEPSSVILSQTMQFKKLKSNDQSKDPVEDQKSHLSFSEILPELCSILVKFYKNLTS